MSFGVNPKTKQITSNIGSAKKQINFHCFIVNYENISHHTYSDYWFVERSVKAFNRNIGFASKKDAVVFKLKNPEAEQID